MCLGTFEHFLAGTYGTWATISHTRAVLVASELNIRNTHWSSHGKTADPLDSLEVIWLDHKEVGDASVQHFLLS